MGSVLNLLKPALCSHHQHRRLPRTKGFQVRREQPASLASWGRLRPPRLTHLVRPAEHVALSTSAKERHRPHTPHSASVSLVHGFATGTGPDKTTLTRESCKLPAFAASRVGVTTTDIHGWSSLYHVIDSTRQGHPCLNSYLQKSAGDMFPATCTNRRHAFQRCLQGNRVTVPFLPRISKSFTQPSDTLLRGRKQTDRPCSCAGDRRVWETEGLVPAALSAGQTAAQLPPATLHTARLPPPAPLCSLSH